MKWQHSRKYSLVARVTSSDELGTMPKKKLEDGAFLIQRFLQQIKTSTQVELCNDYWNSHRRMGVPTHFFEIISYHSQQKCWHQHFFWKRREDIFSQISVEFAFIYRKANAFIKIFKLLGKRLQKTFFVCF